AIVGPDGSGKSSLCAYARRVAETRDRVCHHVTPDPTGAQRSWAPIRALCRELLGLRGKLSLDLIESALRRVGLDVSNLAGTAELFGVAGDFSGLEYAARRRECMASALQIVRMVAA